MKTKVEIKASKFISKAEMSRQGYTLFTQRGIYQVWRHGFHQHEVYRCISGLILGVYQLS